MIASTLNNKLLGGGLLLAFCLLIPLSAHAGYFEFTPEARIAYKKAIHLRFDEARTLIQQIKVKDPDNLIVYQIENYIDFFTIFLNENKQEFKELEKNKSYRLDRISEGDRDSPYYLYAEAEIKLQWALARLKFEEYFKAFNEVRSAYKLLNKNLKKFPEFKASKKSLGILHALVGTIPDQYKWGVKLLGGMDGTVEQGRREIEEVLEYATHNDFVFEEETIVMYALLMLHLNNQGETAWDLVRTDKLDPDVNPLASFVLANVAMHTGRNDEAIRILENRPTDPAFHPFPYLEYMLGLSKLYRLETGAASHFQHYLTHFRGQNYIKEAYQKLAWLALIHGDEQQYYTLIQNCRNKGAALIGGDKNAEKEAKTGLVPHPQLLRARLLFDGGYHQKAYQLLQTAPAAQFRTARARLEYQYRLGRITHQLNRIEEAQQYYQQTYEEGRKEPYYFACNAALQMGLLFEEQQDYYRARSYYKLCLGLRPDEYRNSLHQKAKAGLNRLKGRKAG
ncbi:MAG: hypothetical protein AAGG75_22410 [Bacteroidota bacterium]